MTREEVTKIVNSLQIGESKRLPDGAEVFRISGFYFGYSVISADGDTAKEGISKEDAINLLTPLPW